MAAAYDQFDYPSYWIGRDYEHQSETYAISQFLERIKAAKVVAEIGAGYGRLVPAYAYRAKKIILSDPSSKLLKIAKDETKKFKNIKIVHSKAENLKNKIKTNSVDLAIMVRVLHHIEDPEIVLKEVSRMVKSGGHLILEYPNKMHFKAQFSQIRKGNLTYPMDIFKVDITSKKNKKKGTLPFFNYHPDQITELLEKYDFEVVAKKSVSNIRSSFMKQVFPTSFLLEIEKLLQNSLAIVNFGPSMFLLARKKAIYE